MGNDDKNKSKLKNCVCFCGCDQFTVTQNHDRKSEFYLTCARCNCERRITTPDVGVLKYDISLPFKEDDL